jgi:hypothetical protein
MTYYYLGELERARFYHQKSMDGDLESTDFYEGNTKSLRTMEIESYEADYVRA